MYKGLFSLPIYLFFHQLFIFFMNLETVPVVSWCVYCIDFIADKLKYHSNRKLVLEHTPNLTDRKIAGMVVVERDVGSLRPTRWYTDTVIDAVAYVALEFPQEKHGRGEREVHEPDPRLWSPTSRMNFESELQGGGHAGVDPRTWSSLDYTR